MMMITLAYSEWLAEK